MAIASAQDPRAKVQHQLLRKNKTTRKLTALDGKRRVTKWQKGPNLERMQVAVKRVRVNGESISHVALRSGLPERTLRRWSILSCTLFVELCIIFGFTMLSWTRVIWRLLITFVVKLCHNRFHNVHLCDNIIVIRHRNILVCLYCTDMSTFQKIPNAKTTLFSSVLWALTKSYPNTSERARLCMQLAMETICLW